MNEKRNIKPQSDNYVYVYEDEIDLYELWLRLKKRWKIILGTVSLFTILSIVYIFIAQPIYEGKFAVKLPSYIHGLSKVVLLFSTEEVKIELNKLKNLIKLKRYDKLSSKLNLEIDTVVKIVSIDVHTIRDLKDTVEIKVQTTDPNIIRLISYKIVDYLNNNRYIKELINMKRLQLKEELIEIEKNIESLKNTKKLVEGLINEGKAIYFNPAEIDRTIESFMSKLFTLKTQLKTLKGFSISVEPEIPSEPVKPKKVLILSISFVTSLFLGVFLVLFLEWLEEARRKHEGIH